MILFIGFLIWAFVVGSTVGFEYYRSRVMWKTNKHRAISELPAVIEARSIAEPSRMKSWGECEGRLVWDDGVVRAEMELTGADLLLSWRFLNRETKEDFTAVQMPHEAIHPSVRPRLERFVRMYRQGWEPA